MNRIALLLAIASLSIVGCKKHATTAGPGMNDKREDALLERAKPALNCKEDLVVTFEQSVETNYHLYRVDGCGQRYTSLLHCTGPVCNWIDGPESMAQTDLQCPGPQLSSTYSNQIFTVQGCGRTKTYALDHGKVVPQN